MVLNHEWCVTWKMTIEDGFYMFLLVASLLADDGSKWSQSNAGGTPFSGGWFGDCSTLPLSSTGWWCPSPHQPPKKGWVMETRKSSQPMKPFRWLSRWHHRYAQVLEAPWLFSRLAPLSIDPIHVVNHDSALCSPSVTYSFYMYFCYCQIQVYSPMTFTMTITHQYYTYIYIYI